MPFEPGKATPGAGRKGYTYEAKQQEKLRKQLDKYLRIIDKVFENEGENIGTVKIEFLKEITKIGNKILDKLHADKKQVEMTGELDLPVTIKIVQHGKDD